MTDSSETVTLERKVGNVKWFNNKAGYGFITIDEKTENPVDVFVHYSNIRVSNAQYKYLVQGEYVEFSLSPSTDGRYQFHAIDVSGINGGATLCERRKVAREDSPDSSAPDQDSAPIQRRIPQDRVPRERKPREKRVPDDGFVTVRKRTTRAK